MRSFSVRLRRLLSVLVVAGPAALQGCGNECTLASCFDQLDGTLAADADWPEGFCETAYGALSVNGLERVLEPGDAVDGTPFDPGVLCTPGALTVWTAPDVDSFVLELSDGTVRMTLSNRDAENVSRHRPNGPDCGPVCFTSRATIEVEVLQ